jgi:hypothetical protein
MTRQLILSRGPKSIAGTALIGLGLLILFGNLDGAAAQLSGPLGNTAGEALGVLPSIILTAASQAFQACAFDHQYFLQGLFQMLVSSIACAHKILKIVRRHMSIRLPFLRRTCRARV